MSDTTQKLREVAARGRGGEHLVGAGSAKVVADPGHYFPQWRESMAGRVEVGIDRKLTGELSPGDVVALAPDGSGSVVLVELLGAWDDRELTYGPLSAWLAEWATDALPSHMTPYTVTRHADIG